jgi:hypothetical protein
LSSNERHYRVYHLDRDGRIERSEILCAASDHDALIALRKTNNRCGVELWDRARFLGTAPPYAPQPVT